MQVNEGPPPPPKSKIDVAAGIQRSLKYFVKIFKKLKRLKVIDKCECPKVMGPQLIIHTEKILFEATSMKTLLHQSYHLLSFLLWSFFFSFCWTF